MSETTTEAVDEAARPVGELAPDATTQAPVDASTQAEPTTENEFPSKAVQKRIAKLTFEREEARREKAALQAILEAQQNGTQTAVQPQDFDNRVRQTAAQMRAEEAFIEASNATFQKGVSEFPDFQKAVQSYDMIGGIGEKRAFVEAINALPNGHAVFHHLAKHLDAASDILEMSPVQMAIKLAELSGSLAKPKKQLSNAPTPPSPLGGNAPVPNKDPSKMTMDEFMEWRKSTL